ncbi:MAG TPA: hypothetical protein VJ691_08275 [Vicinamibacterales bacterium]|nr:hypothetical protein [Vicinamibacterales bacterium]
MSPSLRPVERHDANVVLSGKMIDGVGERCGRQQALRPVNCTRRHSRKDSGAFLELDHRTTDGGPGDASEVDSQHSAQHKQQL